MKTLKANMPGEIPKGIILHMKQFPWIGYEEEETQYDFCMIMLQFLLTCSAILTQMLLTNSDIICCLFVAYKFWNSYII